MRGTRRQFGIFAAGALAGASTFALRAAGAAPAKNPAVKKTNGPRKGKPMTEIHGIARQKIHAGKLDEFKRLQAKCMESVRTKDKGTLHYAVYFNSDETECI